jgi:hypothetical protein
MPRKPKPDPRHKPDDEEQSKRFIDTAKELEADKNPKAFERALESIKEKKPEKPD